MEQIIAIHVNKDGFILKNIENDAIVEIDKHFYNELMLKEKNTIQNLIDNNFFVTDKKNKSLSIVIVSTTKCNLKCSYCFESHIHEHTTLRDDDTRKIFNFIEHNLKRGIFDTLDITFTGGEPLTNSTLLKELIAELNDISDRYYVKRKYSIISNGTIISTQILSLLDENNFEIQISLDGPKEIHNLYRIYKNNEVSFDKIIDNITYLAINSNHIRITIRINITTKNLDELKRLYDSLYKKYKEYSKITIYFDFLDVSKDHFLYFSDIEKINTLSEIYLMIYNRTNEVPRYYTIGSNCMIKNNNSVTIHSNGDLYKCYSLVGIDEYKEKSCDYPTINIESIKPLSNYCEDDDCVYHKICLGGCPFHQCSIGNGISIDCHYKILDEINKLYFALDLHKYGYIKLSNIRRVVQNVQIIKIDI